MLRSASRAEDTAAVTDAESVPRAGSVSQAGSNSDNTTALGELPGQGLGVVPWSAPGSTFTSRDVSEPAREPSRASPRPMRLGRRRPRRLPGRKLAGDRNAADQPDTDTLRTSSTRPGDPAHRQRSVAFSLAVRARVLGHGAGKARAQIADSAVPAASSSRPAGECRSPSSAVLRGRRGGVGRSPDAAWSKTFDRPQGDGLPGTVAVMRARGTRPGSARATACRCRTRLRCARRAWIGASS